MSESRLETAKNMWLATVRPDGRPHLIPIWFGVHGGKWYFVTDPRSVKARNLQHNARVALSLEDGTMPLVVEGVARQVQATTPVIQLFKDKFDWDITTDTQYTAVYEVEVTRQVLGEPN
jgi:F420H(2)-dependent biliverdin reductase